MVFTVRLRILLGIILLSCIQSVVNQNVDINTLPKIVKIFRQRYENGQYAVAINVPKEQCQDKFDSSTFLQNYKDLSDQVKPHIKADSMHVHDGHELIAAGRHKSEHSEYLLMNPPTNSHLTKLMGKNKDGCVVFYTLNSPCTDKCLNSEIIIKGLQDLQAYKGIKAFVYTYIFKDDQENDNLQDKLKKIAELVPLYRCNQQNCILCGNPDSHETLNDKCLKVEFSV